MAAAVALKGIDLTLSINIQEAHDPALELTEAKRFSQLEIAELVKRIEKTFKEKDVAEVARLATCLENHFTCFPDDDSVFELKLQGKSLGSYVKKITLYGIGGKVLSDQHFHKIDRLFNSFTELYVNRCTVSNGEDDAYAAYRDLVATRRIAQNHTSWARQAFEY